MPTSGRHPVRRAIVLVVAVLGVGATAAPPAQAAPVLIRGNSISWSPANVTITKGGIVKWRSVDLTHNVYSYGSNWTFAKQLPEGSSTKRRFTRRGTYRFRCTLHSTLVDGVCSGMCGSVRVG